MQEGHRINLGRFGEQLAADFLQRRGYQIVEKNFYTQFGEIDLVAAKDGEFLFCEVKTRTSVDCGYPEMAVDFYKVQKVLKTIGIYLQEKNLSAFWRLDVISVEIDRARKLAKIRHFYDLAF